MNKMLVVVLLAFSLIGCATVRPEGSFTSIGEANPVKDKEVTQGFKKASDDNADYKNVTVLISSLPEGISYDGSVLKVESGYDHEIIGNFRLAPIPPLMAELSFVDYRDDWRKGYCYPQVVLNWATLFLWEISPTMWPCKIRSDNEKSDIVQYVQKISYLSGGDLAIANYLGTGDTALGATGWVLKIDPKLKGKKLITTNINSAKK